MKKYIIYYLVRNSKYELSILDKTGVAVFLSNERNRGYKRFGKGYCDFLIDMVGRNPHDWDFYSFESTKKEKKKIIQDLLSMDTVEEVKSKLQNLEGHKIIYCYYV